MSIFEVIYAKFIFKTNIDKRIGTCRKLASLLRNDFTLMDALSRIEMIESKNGRKPNEPFAIAMRVWQKNLEQGMSFSEATRGWIPDQETLLLTPSNISDLIISLENIGRVVEGTQRIKRAMLGAILYPLFLLFMTFAIIIMVGIYLVPPLVEVAGENVVWQSGAASLVWLSNISNRYWYVFLLTIIFVVFLIAISLPNWTGKLRILFDKLPPWNIYKISISVGWMMALAAMVKGGVSVSNAMRMLASNSNNYLNSILKNALGYISNGYNLGMALSNTDTNFPNEEIIGDLAIYSDMNAFDENIEKIANTYMEESVRKMEVISNTLNSIGILLISAIIAWIILGTFQMQDQITGSMI